MRKKTHSAPDWGRSLNTLAQSETDNTAIIQGEGSEMSSAKVLQGRAKRKVISQSMVLQLIDIANEKGHYDKVKSFWNTYHCQSKLTTSEGRLYGKYCKNRFCTLCCSIRKAEIINRYYPTIRQWEQPYFVTLTIRACKAKGLPVFVQGILKAFKRINAKYRKSNSRKGGIRLMGIKSIECNFNPEKRTYNPHIHLIVSSRGVAEILVKEWLAIWGVSWTSKAAQDFKPVQNLEAALIEIIKYGSKIFTEPDVNKKTKAKTKVPSEGRIYAAALYNIFDAMEGHRIFDRFGFDLPKIEPKTRKGARLISDYSEWLFTPQYFDWLHTESELALTGFRMPNELAILLNNSIDIEKQ